MTDYNDPHTEFIDMVDGVLSEIPECPTVVAEQAMRRAAREFYKQTWAWTSVLPSQELRSGFRTYGVESPYAAAILGLDRLETDEDSLPDWEFEPPRSLRFKEDPEDGVVVSPVAVLQPSPWATGVPADHPNLWMDTWEHGCLYYLRQQPRQPWYAPEEARRQYRQFSEGIKRTRNHLARGHRSGPTSINPNPLA